MKKLICIIFGISFLVSFVFCSYVMVQNNNIVKESRQRQEQLEKRVLKHRMEYLGELMQRSKKNYEQLIGLFIEYNMPENARDMIYVYDKLQQFENYKEAIDYDVLLEFRRRDIYSWQKVYVSEDRVKNDPKWESLKHEHDVLMQKYDAYISLIEKKH